MYHGMVARYPFMDHNAPAFDLLLPCCANIHRFLQADPDNVAAVHCKAGKGRTGLIIVCYLLYGGLRRKAVESRAFYDAQRCHDKKGLTIISQIRYTHYFETYLQRLKDGVDCPVGEKDSPAVAICSVVMHGIPRHGGSGCAPLLRISVRHELDHEIYTLFQSSDHTSCPRLKVQDGKWALPVNKFVKGGVRVAGDIQVQISNETQHIGGTKEAPLCWVWVHSQFMQDPPDMMAGKSQQLSDKECAEMGMPAGSYSLLMDKGEIDGAAKDHKNKTFPEEFQLEIFWHFLPGEIGSDAALDAAYKAANGVSSLQGIYNKKIPEKADYYAHCLSEGDAAMSFKDYILSRPVTFNPTEESEPTGKDDQGIKKNATMHSHPVVNELLMRTRTGTLSAATAAVAKETQTMNLQHAQSVVERNASHQSSAMSRSLSAVDSKAPAPALAPTLASM